MAHKVVKLRGGVVEAEFWEGIGQLRDSVKGTHTFAAGFNHGPQPGKVDMGVACQRDGPFLREAGLQGAQARAQVVAGGDYRCAGRFGQGLRGGKGFGQFPDRLAFSGGGDARQVALRFGGPFQQVKGGLGQVDHGGA